MLPGLLFGHINYTSIVAVGQEKNVAFLGLLSWVRRGDYFCPVRCVIGPAHTLTCAPESARKLVGNPPENRPQCTTGFAGVGRPRRGCAGRVRAGAPAVAVGTVPCARRMLLKRPRATGGGGPTESRPIDKYRHPLGMTKIYFRLGPPVGHLDRVGFFPCSRGSALLESQAAQGSSLKVIRERSEVQQVHPAVEIEVARYAARRAVAAPNLEAEPTLYIRRSAPATHGIIKGVDAKDV